MPNKKDKTSFLVLPILKRSIICFAVEVALLFVSSLILLNTNYNFQNVYAVVFLIIYTFSVLFCSVITIKTTKEKTAISCFLSEFIMLILNYATILAFSGFKLEIKSLILIPIALAATLICLVMKRNRK